ncbi:MAG: hypothetical protein AAGE61_08110 [Pseudomonadota bacterium]
MKPLFTTSFAALAIALSVNSASARDWLERVEILNDGIDTKAISVRAKSNGYTATTHPRHLFKLTIHAKTKSGKRIAGMKIGTDIATSVHESDHNSLQWTYQLPHRDIGSGTKRTVTRHEKHTIRLNKLIWVAGNPVDRCNALLQKKMQQGMSKSAALSKIWTTTARAQFVLYAIATGRKAAEAGNFWASGPLKIKWDDARDATTYTVRVRCLAAPTHQNQVQNQNQGEQSSQGDKPAKPFKVLNGALNATGFGLGIASGFKGQRPARRPGTFKARPLSAQ